MIVIVTGSRNWTDVQRECAALAECERALKPGDTLRIRHGGAKGADRIAGDWAWWAYRAGRPVLPPEMHRAKWTDPCRDTCSRSPKHRRVDKSGVSTCPMAGYYRNEDMVAMEPRANLVLAFLAPCEKPRCKDPQPHASHGAAQCVQCARFAGIDVIPFLTAGLTLAPVG